MVIPVKIRICFSIDPISRSVFINRCFGNDFFLVSKIGINLVEVPEFGDWHVPVLSELVHQMGWWLSQGRFKELFRVRAAQLFE